MQKAIAGGEIRAALESVVRPVNEANGLPNACYIDADHAPKEREALFQNTWAAIGFEKDVADPGSAFPVDMLGVPLVMVRARDGVLRVFQNVCRHRGMILIDKPGPLRGVIRCPYHSWCYEQNGKLRATPHVGGPGHNTDPSIDRSTLGLIEVRSATWMGVVFANVSGTAPAFEEHIAPLAKRWSEFADRPLYHAGDCSSFKLEVATNWKLAVENYCESYHLPWVHPGLNAYSRLEDHYNIIEGRSFSGQGTLVYSPQLDESGRKFRDFTDLSDKWDRAAEYVALYPNVLYGVHRDHTFAIVLEPKGVDRTIEHIEIYYAAQESASDGYSDLRLRNAALWKSVFVEDIFVVEGMQRGRHASNFDGGRFSPAMDAATHCFHDWVAGRILENDYADA